MRNLIEENRVLKEQLESSGRRLRLTDDPRRRLAAKGKPLGRKVLRTIATIVTPDTILAWHRRLNGKINGLARTAAVFVPFKRDRDDVVID